MNPNLPDDAASPRPVFAFRLLKFPTDGRRTAWQQRQPEGDDAAWARLWGNLSFVKERAPRTVETLSHVVAQMVQQLAKGGSR
jgi:hypothetical protein